MPGKCGETSTLTGQVRTAAKVTRNKTDTLGQIGNTGNDSHLVYEGATYEVRAPRAEIDDVGYYEQGVVQGIQEPRRVGHLVQQVKNHPNICAKSKTVRT